VAFCYFEALVRTADAYKFEEEVTRLKSFTEEAWELLLKLANTSVDVGMALLLEKFNDMGVSMAMITYFKVRLLFGDSINSTKRAIAPHERMDEEVSRKLSAIYQHPHPAICTS
jgi:hypothetical protein